MAASQTSRPGRTRQGTRVRYHSPAMFAWGVFAAALATSAMVGSAPSRAAAAGQRRRTALACWREAGHAHDSLFSVTRMQARLWDSTVRPVNHNSWVLLRTQDLPPLYIENSNFYVFTADLIKSSRRRIGDRPKMFEIDPLESLDIDDEQSFALAEQLMRVKTQSKS